MKRFAKGFHLFFAGLRLWIRSKKLLGISAFPLVIDFFCLAGGAYVAFLKIPSITAMIVSAPVFWYQYLLYYFVMIITALSLLLIVIFGVYVVASLLTFPFNDILAERTLRHHEVLQGEPRGFKGWMKRSAANSGAMFRRTAILLVVGCFLFLSTLIPGVAVIAGFISAVILATDRIDYSFDQFGWSFKQRVSFIKSALPEIVGFAAALGLTSLIPIINILIMPGSIVAGAVLVSDLIKKGPTPLERPHSQASR
jgi:CysZ protein